MSVYSDNAKLDTDAAIMTLESCDSSSDISADHSPADMPHKELATEGSGEDVQNTSNENGDVKPTATTGDGPAFRPKGRPGPPTGRPTPRPSGRPR